MSLDHPNIVKVYNLYEDERYFRIITEYPMIVANP